MVLKGFKIAILETEAQYSGSSKFCLISIEISSKDKSTVVFPESRSLPVP